MGPFYEVAPVKSPRVERTGLLRMQVRVVIRSGLRPAASQVRRRAPTGAPDDLLSVPAQHPSVRSPNALSATRASAEAVEGVDPISVADLPREAPGAVRRAAPPVVCLTTLRR